jgi:hypothetical protein
MPYDIVEMAAHTLAYLSLDASHRVQMAADGAVVA